MRTSLIKALVDALGERGHVSLPLVEQLLPVLAMSDLPKLGSPLGYPIAKDVTVAAVAAERSGVMWGAAPGYVVRIDRLKSHASDCFISMGGSLSEGNESYVITDARRAQGSQAGLVKGCEGRTETAAVWAAGLAGTVIATLQADAWWEGPIYLVNPIMAFQWHAADNLAGQFQMVGEVFPLG